MADLAYRVQDEVERALLDVASDLRSRSSSRKLCLAGGVALNSAANYKLLQHAGFDDIFVVPAAGDDGVSLGCAYWGTYKAAVSHPPARGARLASAAYGRRYSRAEVERVRAR